MYWGMDILGEAPGRVGGPTRRGAAITVGMLFISLDGRGKPGRSLDLLQWQIRFLHGIPT